MRDRYSHVVSVPVGVVSDVWSIVVRANDGLQKKLIGTFWAIFPSMTSIE